MESQWGSRFQRFHGDGKYRSRFADQESDGVFELRAPNAEIGGLGRVVFSWVSAWATSWSEAIPVSWRTCVSWSDSW